jgi:hypothetical protein
MSISTALDDLHQRIKMHEDRVLAASDLLYGKMRTGSNTPDFEYMEADFGDFVVPPIQSARFDRISAQTISTGLWVSVQFEEQVWNNGPWRYSTASTGTFTHARPPNLEGYFFYGWVKFGENSSGFRGIAFNRLPSGRDVLAQVRPATDGETVIPIAYPYRANSSATGFNLQVYNGGVSASPPLLLGASLGIMKVIRQ